MDAKSSVAAVCLCCLLAAAGCLRLNSEPAARPQESEDSPPTERVEVVGAPDAQELQSAGDIQPDMEAVRRWIEQVQRRDDIRSRVEPRAAERTPTLALEGTYEPGAQEPGRGRERDATGYPNEAKGTDPDALSGPAHSPGTANPLKDEAPAPEAPRLERVGVRAGVPPRTPAALVGDAAPSVNAPAQAAHQPITLAEFADQWPARPADTSFRNQLDRRLLQTLAGRYEDARQPLELVSSEQQQMARHFVEALIAVREAHGGEPGAEANRVLAELEQLAESLIPLSDLRISKLLLTRAVHGFGRYESFDPPHLPAGRENEFVVYCELERFVSRPKDDGGHESHFSMRTAVLNRAGDVVLEINDEHIVDECQARRRDCFIPRLIRLPATLSPGEYVVKVTIIDKIGKKVAEKRTTFRIVARS